MPVRKRKLSPRSTRSVGPLPVVLGPGLSQNVQPTIGYEVRAALQALVIAEDTPAAARVNAARTLAEMDGLIGRHQIVPDREAPSLATLSRDALVDELERLRTAVSLGLVR